MQQLEMLKILKMIFFFLKKRRFSYLFAYLSVFRVFSQDAIPGEIVAIWEKNITDASKFFFVCFFTGVTVNDFKKNYVQSSVCIT